VYDKEKFWLQFKRLLMSFEGNDVVRWRGRGGAGRGRSDGGGWSDGGG